MTQPEDPFNPLSGLSIRPSACASFRGINAMADRLRAAPGCGTKPEFDGPTVGTSNGQTNKDPARRGGSWKRLTGFWRKPVGVELQVCQMRHSSC